MEGKAISATIEVLLQNLINLSKQEISLIRDLDENVEKLRDTFGMIQSFLDDAQTRSITEAAVKKWLTKLEATMFDADNALDELNYELLSSKRKGKVASCFPSFHLRDVALRINNINASFKSINESAAGLGLQQRLAAAAPAAASDAARETDSVTVDPIFIGRDDDVLKIVEMLTTRTEEAVSILPIVGMGGLGKTTLARNVFNHHKTINHFGERIWVHVSRDFDAVILFKKILTHFGPRVSKAVTREDHLRGLQRALDSKTYLLVLDDVWNEDGHKWDDFMNSWSGITCTKGNGILVTTRSTEVGSIVKTVDIPPLNYLSVEQCWSIIKFKAFKGGDTEPGLEAMGQSIAVKCQGLPLAASMVGGVLRGKPQYEWRSIEQHSLSNVGGDANIISKILELSFHHLSSPSLKKCFAYCSIFPKGAWIPREQLIELWMAEGFLLPSQATDDMENVGNHYLKVLVHNSLLQVVDRDEYGNVKHCSMHDLVHDVAGSVLDFHLSDGTYRARYIRWSGDESGCIPEEQAKWLRAVFYEDKISNIIFPHFKSLHSLTLAVADDFSLPNSIRVLIHLRYLHISGACIKSLPKQIGELYHLQTLRAETKKLPSTLTYLINLRHLHVPSHAELPPHLGRLTSLQTLPCFKVREEEGHQISELGRLNNIKGKLEISNLEKVQGEEESKKANLIQKSGIVKLALFWGVVSVASREGDKNVLNGLQPHPNLMVLEIVGFKAASFPLWTLKMAAYLEGRWEGFNNLMEITISFCVECDEIPSLGHLPRLKSLHLSHLHNLKSIGSSFYGIDNFISSSGVCKETIRVFPTLERLEFSYMENLTEWEEVEIPGAAQVMVFPCLEYLMITGCNQLRSAPSQFTCLKDLIVGEMESGSPLANICGDKLKTLTKLKILLINGLACLPDRLFHNNQNLSVLEIMYCRNLIELPDGVDSLKSLEELNLEYCGNLRSIPYSVNGGLASLSKLSIWGCPKLTNFPLGIVESCAPLLEKLNIDVGDSDSWHCVSFRESIDGLLRLGSQSLRRLELRGHDWDSFPDQLQHMTALSHLFLYNFSVQELPEWFGNFSSLQELKLSECRELEHLPSVEAMLRLSNLTDLHIRNSPFVEEKCIEQQSDDVDSEWPKICHIPNIRIGFRQIRSGGVQPSTDFEYGGVFKSAFHVDAECLYSE